MYHKVVTLLLLTIYRPVVWLFAEFSEILYIVEFFCIFRRGIAESEGMNVFKPLDRLFQVAF